MLDINMQWAISKIVEKLSKNFYGSITLNFQAGKLHTIETRQMEKPEQ